MPSQSSHFTGHPELIHKIIAEIAVGGPLTFARFMDLSLYDKQHGYYMTSAVNPDSAATTRIGWGGDFYTAPELSPLLAKTLVRQVREVDDQLGHPDSFTFVEMGGGNGTFAIDFLKEVRSTAPEFFERLRYVMVERSGHLQSCQEGTIREAMGSWMESHVAWKSSIDHLPHDSVIGVMFSNELVDAFPVHRVRLDNQQLQELYVDYEQGQFVERFGPLSSSLLEEYVREHRVVLGEGQCSELHLAAEAWMSSIAHVLHRGIVITIDYGHTGPDYYASTRKDGTFVCYYRHTVSTDPYTRVGEQDMTAHVNFSMLVRSAKRLGLLLVGYTTLTNWLVGLGVEAMVQDDDPESQEIRALSQLLRPHGMGSTFKVLVQQKGIEEVRLQGLRYRAFFDDVLEPS